MLQFIFNSLISINLINQSFHIKKILEADIFLDSSTSRSIYKSYYVLLIVSLLTSLFWNLSKISEFQFISAPSSNVIFTIPIIFIASMHLYKSSSNQDQEVENSGLYYETDNLLSNQNSQIDSNISSRSNAYQIKVKMSPQVHSKNVSPIGSLYSKKSLKLHSFSFSNNLNKTTPILATLMNSETTLAASMTSSIGSSTPSTSQTFLQICLIFAIVLCFTSSQVLYSITIFNTNLYTPQSHQYLTFTINLMLGLVSIGYILITNSSLNSMINFHEYNLMINSIIPIMIIIQAITSLTIQVWNKRKGKTPNISHISVYNSMDSPILS